MTPKQTKDLEVTKYFIPTIMNGIEITKQDEERYLEWSERGLHKDLVDTYKMDGFNALIQGKQWRGVHMEMWEDTVLEGIIGYRELLLDVPKSVMEFMSKEMFKGIDKNKIELLYAKAI